MKWLAWFTLVVALAAYVSDTLSQTTKPKPMLEQEYQFLLPDTCMSEQDRERVRALLFEMLDAALKQHARQVFETWMQGISDQQQPARARKGTRLGIAAYLKSRDELRKWNPPQC